MSNARIRSWSVAAAFALVVAAAPAAVAGEGQDDRPQRGGGDGWDLALTGGFVASGLVDPVYALGTIPGRPTRVVVRDTDRESSASLGVAMFAEVYNDRRLRWLAPVAFGVGIRNDRAVFYLGPALRFGSHASLVGGVAAGPVAALPPGLHEHDTVADTNMLSNLSSRTAITWFAGVTYTFASIR